MPNLLALLLLIAVPLQSLDAQSLPTAPKKRLAPRQAQSSTKLPSAEQPCRRSEDRHLILMDGGSDSSRRKAAMLIAKHADGYWHRVSNVWIVGGGTARLWRDRLRGVAGAADVRAILVLRMPTAERRAWAAASSPRFCSWLQSDYAQKIVPPLSVKGSVRTRKTWNNGPESLGGDTNKLGLQLSTKSAPRAVLTYRGSRLVITRRGQSFRIQPYANTTATATVREFSLSERAVKITLGLSGVTSNRSVVFRNGHRYTFSGDLTITGSRTASGFRVTAKDRHMWRGLGNARWDGTTILR